MTRIRTILVGVDFTSLSEIALRAAARIADEVGAERLHLVHVMQGSPGWAIPLHEGIALAWKSALELAEKTLSELAVPSTRARVTRQTSLGGPAFELVAASEAVEADLIVVATHQRGPFGRIVLGSVASTLVRAARCPVLVVGEDRPALAPVRRVLAPVDLSPVSTPVIAAAVELARPQRGLVQVLSLYELPALMRDEDVLARFITPEESAAYAEKYRAQVAALVAEVRVPEVEVVVDVMSKSPPARVIRDVAEMTRPDLIVVGTSGHNAWQRMFLGSTASAVLAEAPCPVLVVPHGTR